MSRVPVITPAPIPFKPEHSKLLCGRNRYGGSTSVNELLHEELYYYESSVYGTQSNDLITVSATQGDSPPRSVNVALETSFVFDPKEIQESKYVINNLRKFLESLDNILKPRSNRHIKTAKRKSIEPKRGQYRKFDLIEWIKETGKKVANETVRGYNAAVDSISSGANTVAETSKGTYDNLKPKKDLIEYVKFWRTQIPDEINKHINATLAEDNPLLNKITRRLNAYYSNADVKTLYNILWKFKSYLERDMDTSNLVKELMNSVIFKKYESLDDAAKADLKKDFKTFAEYVSLNSNLKNLDKYQDLSYTRLRRTIDRNLKVAREAKKHNKGNTNELVVNKIELLLE